ncbi:MAG: hypothetical protein RIG27_06755 [Coleofasciculus sp. F4-SAH-05]
MRNSFSDQGFGLISDTNAIALLLVLRRQDLRTNATYSRGYGNAVPLQVASMPSSKRKS